jgi:hypothetical protein
MAKDKNNNLIIDYFDGADKADDAADSLKAMQPIHSKPGTSKTRTLTWAGSRF